jgi:hypothetical protein
MMPATMKTALKTSSGSDDPAILIAPITDLMSDFHGSVDLPATTALTGECGHVPTICECSIGPHQGGRQDLDGCLLRESTGR